MIDYMKFDVMFFDEVIASVDLKPNNSGLAICEKLYNRI